MREDLGARALLADPVGLDADVAGGLRVARLLLRAHDRLQRRVARLVDGVADGDDGRQLDVDGVVAVLGLALAAELAALDVDLDHLRQRRHLQVVGHDGADRVALAVVRLLAEQHEVGRLRLEHLGERVAGGGHVRARRARRRSGAPSGRRRAPRPCCSVRTALRGAIVTATISSTSTAPPSRICMAASMAWVSNWFSVLLARAVEALGTRVHALLDCGVGHLFYEDADLHGNASPSFILSGGRRARPAGGGNVTYPVD